MTVFEQIRCFVSGEFDGGEIVVRPSIVAGVDAAHLFEAIEEARDSVALAVRARRTVRPSASTTAWIFVISPLPHVVAEARAYGAEIRVGVVPTPT